MNAFKTEKAKERAVRRAYRAMDALQDLVDRGICGAEAERAMGAVRQVIYAIEEIEVRSTKKGGL